MWIISRNYNEAKRMLPLMKRIASEIAGKVSERAEITTAPRPPASSLFPSISHLPPKR